jgi:hypothetical protein
MVSELGVSREYLDTEIAQGSIDLTRHYHR